MRPLERLYRLATRALPRSFRSRYAGEMLDAFRRAVSETRRERGRAAAVRRALRETADALATGARLRLRVEGGAARGRELRSRSVPPPPGGPGDALVVELRQAVRALLRRPGFAASCVLTLGIGIGAATLLFAVAGAVLLRPLPYPDSDRLVMAWRVVERFGFDRAPLSYPDYLDWRAGSRAFDDLAAYAVTAGTLLDDGEPERLTGARVTGNLFATLGVGAEIGRAIQPSDDRADAEPVVVLSHALWRLRFGGDPGVVGRTVRLGEELRRVVGVARRDFAFPTSRTQYWVPLRMDPAAAERDMNFLQVIGRLRPGVPLEAAEADLRATARRVSAAHPGENELDDAWLEPRHAYVVGDVGPVLRVLAAAVALLLVLSGANLVNLLLVRTSARKRELAIRSSLGAGARRLRQSLLVESLLLTLAGGAVGVGISAIGVRVLLALEPGALPRREEIAVDTPVLLFALALSVACALLCGWGPAAAAARQDPAGALRAGSGAGRDRRSGRLQGALVTTQIAVAAVLLVAAGLLGRSFARLVSVPTGFEGTRVLTAQVALPPGRYPEEAQIHGFYDRLLERLEALPGVERAAATWALPFSLDYASSSYAPEGAAAGEGRTVSLAPVRGGFFRAMGMTLLRGRGFGATDHRDAPPVAVVNETLARLFWPGEDPIGKRLLQPGEDDEPITVVGVVADAKRRSLDEATEPEAYLPHEQATWGGAMYLVVRTTGPPERLAAALRHEVWAIDPELPVSGVSGLDDRISESLAPPRFRTVLFAALAGVAAVLALLGTYGVLSFVVAQRTREIAVRLALGATRGRVLSDVLGHSARLAGAGVLIGAVVAAAGTRSLQAFLFRVTPLDPPTFAAVPALLLAAALLASWLPARRASRTDPMRALREQ